MRIDDNSSIDATLLARPVVQKQRSAPVDSALTRQRLADRHGECPRLSVKPKMPPGSTTGSAAPAPKPNPWYPDHAMFNTTKDELTGMPEFTFSNK